MRFGTQDQLDCEGEGREMRAHHSLAQPSSAYLLLLTSLLLLVVYQRSSRNPQQLP